MDSITEEVESAGGNARKTTMDFITEEVESGGGNATIPKDSSTSEAFSGGGSAALPLNNPKDSSTSEASSGGGSAAAEPRKPKDSSTSKASSGGGSAALPLRKPKDSSTSKASSGGGCGAAVPRKTSRRPKDSTSEASSSGGGSGAVPRNSRKPKGSKFFQQEMRAYRLHMTPKRDILVFVLIGVICIPFGVGCLLASRSVVEIVERYDEVCIPGSKRDNPLSFIQDATSNKTCTREITVLKNMTQPIYVYYQLNNFYQMHPRYFMSRSDYQLRSIEGENETKSCKHEAKTADNQTIVPCGLIAWSMFNDTYSFSRSPDNKTLAVNKTDISWKSDRDRKFGDKVFPKNFQKGVIQGGAVLNESIPLNQQEDLIVWMRPAALPTFRKLYGRIEEDLAAGDTIVVTIQNNYNTYQFDGKKTLVLSTTSWIGGKNDFLGIAFLIVGGLCLFLALVLTIIYLVKPRQLGDSSSLSWNRNPSGHLRTFSSNSPK